MSKIKDLKPYQLHVILDSEYKELISEITKKLGISKKKFIEKAIDRYINIEKGQESESCENCDFKLIDRNQRLLDYVTTTKLQIIYYLEYLQGKKTIFDLIDAIKRESKNLANRFKGKFNKNDFQNLEKFSNYYNQMTLKGSFTLLNDEIIIDSPDFLPFSPWVFALGIFEFLYEIGLKFIIKIIGEKITLRLIRHRPDTLELEMAENRRLIEEGIIDIEMKSLEIKNFIKIPIDWIRWIEENTYFGFSIPQYKILEFKNTLLQADLIYENWLDAFLKSLKSLGFIQSFKFTSSEELLSITITTQDKVLNKLVVKIIAFLIFTELNLKLTMLKEEASLIEMNYKKIESNDTRFFGEMYSKIDLKHYLFENLYNYKDFKLISGELIQDLNFGIAKASPKTLKEILKKQAHKLAELTKRLCYRGTSQENVETLNEILKVLLPFGKRDVTVLSKKGQLLISIKNTDKLFLKYNEEILRIYFEMIGIETKSITVTEKILTINY
ncbi:MAG: hypothetical protein ACTSVE_10385 [Candidatus Helarchaeota archaeon]